jgi:hypothetical protein
LPPPSPDNPWRRYGRWVIFTVIAMAALLIATAYVYADTSSDWAVVVVAGDWHDHDGRPSEIFDNARRDVAAELARAGFNPSDIAQFSVRPSRYPAAHPFYSEARGIEGVLGRLANRTRAGCLLYFTSHGGPSGMVLGQAVLSPASLNAMISDACGERPTIVVVSACYSGVFVRPLAAPNRMILTAARPDRSSFGCSGTDKYPYFDACFLSGLNETNNFRALALDTRRCVARLERQTRMWPPSQPQLFIGSRIASRLPAWR